MGDGKFSGWDRRDFFQVAAAASLLAAAPRAASAAQQHQGDQRQKRNGTGAVYSLANMHQLNTRYRAPSAHRITRTVCSTMRRSRKRP